jgi:hypothetical protein
VRVQGRTVLRRTAPVYLRGINELFGTPLSDAELRAIKCALERVLDARHADE